MKLVAANRLSPHPDAHLVPEMSPEQYAEFLDDIRERGVLVPIEVIQGRTIVDGLSRWTAAKEIGIGKVPVVDAPVNGISPVIYMLRAATKRRHLTDDQRACLAQEELEIVAALSRKRRATAGGIAGGRGRPKAGSSAITSDAEQTTRDRTGDARTSVANGYRISERRVEYARRLKREAPKLYRKVKSGRMRLAVARREAERRSKRRLQQKLARNAKQTRNRKHCQIIVGDAITELNKIKAETVRLIFADPPYNLGVDYGRGPRADKLPDGDYLTWCREWLAACVRLLTDDGSLWVMINDEYADHFGVMLRETGLPRRSWIKWYETFGVNCTNNFNRCSRHIFYHVKNRRKFVFNREAVTRPSDRQEKYADKRADPAGKLWDNVWCIPRLVENSKERLPDFPTQLPLELVRPIVLCATDPGDLVVDPFSGSGTTGAAAINSGRRFIGIEQNRKFAKWSERRLGVLL